MGDWHHLKISVKLAAGTCATDNHKVFYHVVADRGVWELSVNSSGTCSIISTVVHIVLHCRVLL